MLSVRAGGAWRNENGVWIYAGGSWRPVAQVWVATDDPLQGFEWRTVVDYAPPDVLVPNPSFYREGTGVIGPLTLVVSWATSSLPERSSWTVQATVQGDFYFQSETRHQSAGSMQFEVPSNQRGGLFTASIRYGNTNGLGPETILYYND